MRRGVRRKGWKKNLRGTPPRKPRVNSLRAALRRELENSRREEAFREQELLYREIDGEILPPRDAALED